ncbi:hypothetical protein HS048_26565 [Planomonospora sp. ID91781]|uniref:hypothetical protein n=1 Tax=Planomonospora sp. ID91781 TaxID=2738135 RepID=UPI0018C3F899|nr:hypothetical protein [Planomonospora sp. ID91781]MBG0824277.1 hypothetical protein [Planomonospora sp. ID91781]
MTVVQHRPRTAWDAARAFVAAADCDVYWWLTDTVAHHLGAAYRQALTETRLRLQRREDAVSAEAGAWRARLEELLQDRPDLAPVLRRLAAETAGRLPR